MKILLFDNYDSFTYNLLDYLLQQDAEVKVLRNDACNLDEIADWQPDGMVISPGPGKPVESGNLMMLIDRFCRQLPILGVCLGHQALGEYFGANLTKAQRPMHGKTSIIRHNGHQTFANIPNPMEVMRYHSLLLSDVDENIWEITARTDEAEIMAMAHRNLPLWGVQFHPESILTRMGQQIILNWLKSIIVNL